MNSGAPMNMRLDTREIARALPVRQVLRALGLRVRNSKRADCPLCKGNSYGTIAYTERFWRCHRCQEGGDVFSLVCAVNRYDFREALRFTAELAGIRLEDPRNPDFRQELAARRRQREHIDHSAEKLAALENALRFERRNRIHDAERKRQKVGERLAELSCGKPERFRGEQEGLWLTLQAIAMLLNTDVPAYMLLSFGAVEERARFVLHPELRDEIASGVRRAGYVRTADGKQVEVLA